MLSRCQCFYIIVYKILSNSVYAVIKAKLIQVSILIFILSLITSSTCMRFKLTLCLIICMIVFVFVVMLHNLVLYH